MGKVISHKFEDIISIENLLIAWKEFVKNKRNRPDIKFFEKDLMKNIVELNADLSNLLYKHSNYQEFKVSDPKPRIIHKATVRDRLVHRAVYRILYPKFDGTFIFDSYSCRKNKGTHKAFKRLVGFTRKQSKNYSKSCWALKIDIKKFFHSVDHQVLLGLLEEKISDIRILWLLRQVIESFNSYLSKGMPLGNLTSQLFANIYLDPLDKFIKHKLKVRFYLRYADDLLILSGDRGTLLIYLKEIQHFVENIRLFLHEKKIHLRKLSWGIDFVGYEAHEGFNLPRRKTVKRILRKIAMAAETESKKSLPSYLGYLKHANAFLLSEKIKSRLRS